MSQYALFPGPPKTFYDVLEAALYHIWDMDVNGFGKRMMAAYPNGWGSTKEQRDSLFPLMMAFAVKEQKTGDAA